MKAKYIKILILIFMFTFILTLVTVDESRIKEQINWVGHEREGVIGYKDKIKWTMMGRDFQLNGETATDTQVIHFLENKFNVDLELIQINSPTQQEMFERLNMMISVGEIPDVISNVNINGIARRIHDHLVDQGQLLDVEAFAANYSGRYPNIERILAEGETGIYRHSDDRLYIIPKRIGVFPHMWIIRKDWLDGLGLSMPSTLKELSNTLKLIVQKDPGGKQNQGITLAGTWWLNHFYAGFTGAYEWAEIDGRLISVWMLPEQKEAVKYVRNLYMNGCLDKDFLTNTPNNEDVLKFAGGKALMINSTFDELFYKERKLLEKYPDAVIGFLPAQLEGPKGIARVTGLKFFEGIMIYKDVKDPKRLFDFLDYIVSEEGLNLFTWGVEGVHYNIDKNGRITKNQTILKAEEWGLKGYFPWHWPIYSLLDCRPIINDDILANMTSNPKALKDFFEELDNVQPITNPLNNYYLKVKRNEELNELRKRYEAAFILGEKDIDEEWDEFLTEYKKAGYDELEAEINMKYKINKLYGRGKE